MTFHETTIARASLDVEVGVQNEQYGNFHRTGKDLRLALAVAADELDEALAEWTIEKRSQPSDFAATRAKLVQVGGIVLRSIAAIDAPEENYPGDIELGVIEIDQSWSQNQLGTGQARGIEVGLSNETLANYPVDLDEIEQVVLDAVTNLQIDGITVKRA